MQNIANIRLHSALKDAVDAMISGTGLKGKETGNRIDLFDHTGNQWGSVE